MRSGAKRKYPGRLKQHLMLIKDVFADSYHIFTITCIFDQTAYKIDWHRRINQGHVIAKPNLLILRLLAGYGYLFFGLCPT
jgi:hypothetical protein